MSQSKHSFYLSWWLVKYAMEHDKVKEQKQRNRCEGRKSNSQGKSKGETMHSSRFHTVL